MKIRGEREQECPKIVPMGLVTNYTPFPMERKDFLGSYSRVAVKFHEF